MRHPARILVVDDEERFRENMLKFLTAAGHYTAGAEHGARALEMMEEDRFDLVLLDLSMPELPGEQTLQLMRHRGMDAQVIVLTGHASIEMASDMLALGAFDFLLKPATSAEILKKIDFAMEQREVDALDLEKTDTTSRTPSRE